MGKVRKTATKEKIKAAFIDLLEEEGFQKMTVAKLAKRAHINRGTFYLNYLDLNDLKDQLMNAFFNGALKITNDNPKGGKYLFSEEIILRIVDYLKDNYALIHALLMSDLNAEMTAQLNGVLRAAFDYHAHFKNPAVKEPYASSVVFSSVTTIFVLWIERGMEESPEELANIITNYRVATPEDLIGK